MKWYHHILAFCIFPIFMFLFFYGLEKFIIWVKSMPENYETWLAFIIGFLLFGTMGYFTIINEFNEENMGYFTITNEFNKRNND